VRLDGDDIEASLPEGFDGEDYAYGFVCDVAMAGDAALVCWYDNGEWASYVVAVELDDQGEPMAAPRDSWLEVELAYVAVDGARSGLRRLEDRAGKALSAENAGHVAGIADAVSAMQGHVDELLSQMSDDDRPSSGDSEANGDGVPDPDAQDEVIESNSLSPRRLWADFLTAAWGENGER
jgi:hypothetical protein